MVMGGSDIQDSHSQSTVQASGMWLHCPLRGAENQCLSLHQESWATPVSTQGSCSSCSSWLQQLYLGGRGCLASLRPTSHILPVVLTMWPCPRLGSLTFASMVGTPSSAFLVPVSIFPFLLGQPCNLLPFPKTTSEAPVDLSLWTLSCSFKVWQKPWSGCYFPWSHWVHCLLFTCCPYPHSGWCAHCSLCLKNTPQPPNPCQHSHASIPLNYRHHSCLLFTHSILRVSTW